MLSHSAPSFEQSIPDGRLVLQDKTIGLYAVFQTSLCREVAMVSELQDTQAYTYARIVAHGWRLTRADADTVTGSEPLMPEHEGQFDVQLRQSILMLPPHEVEAALETFGKTPTTDDWPPSSLAAEQLFRGCKGMTMGGVAIEACGTYSRTGDATELVIVDDNGGYSFGLSTMDGIATDLSLAMQAKSQQCFPAIQSSGLR